MNPTLGGIVLQLLIVAIQNPQLQDQLLDPIARLLTDALPDVTEDAIAQIIIRLGEKVRDVNP